MIEIIIVPAANGRYRAILDRRELIISRTREPFFSRCLANYWTEGADRSCKPRLSEHADDMSG